MSAMFSIERNLKVNFRLRVFFTRNIFGEANPLLRDILLNGELDREHRVLMIVDESLARARPELCAQIETWFAASPQLKLVCAPLVIEGGERTKNSLVHVSEIQSHIERHHIDRHACVIALGGGALLDMAGLAAATAHRGVRHVRLPTTTLSQADSGVGVKNGINAFGKKNFIGTFAPPFAVVNDFELLGSLPDRDKRAGYVEAVKVALIRDREFFEALEADAAKLTAFEPAAMERLIEQSARLHVEHIATGGDPFEQGSARPLDFGHWAAHKLEQMSDYRLRHGEAVAVGIALDTVYARNAGLLDAASAERALNLLEAMGFELWANELLHADEAERLLVLNGLEEFREHLGGKLAITLVNAIGQGVEANEMNFAKMASAIYELQDRHAKRTNVLPIRREAS
jgi:3-dehydroquinate synthase